MYVYAYIHNYIYIYMNIHVYICIYTQLHMYNIVYIPGVIDSWGGIWAGVSLGFCRLTPGHGESPARSGDGLCMAYRTVCRVAWSAQSAVGTAVALLYRIVPRG